MDTNDPVDLVTSTNGLRDRPRPVMNRSKPTNLVTPTHRLPKGSRPGVDLIYDRVTDTSAIKNVLLIHNEVTDYNTFITAANSDTFPIVYNKYSSKEALKKLLQEKFASISRIAIVFHNGNINPSKVFLDYEPLFTTEDLTSVDAAFSNNMKFIIEISNLFHVTNLDFLACNTLKYDSWKTYYKLLNEHTNATIGASNDLTGNLKYGGDWTLENTNEDIKNVYFTDLIENYQYTLDATNISQSGGHVYLRQTSTSAQVEWTPDNTTAWSTVTWPLSITNQSSSGATLTVQLTTDITFNTSVGDVAGYIMIGSANITIDGSYLGVNHKVTIDDVNGYPGLVNNGAGNVNNTQDPITAGFTNITIQNIGVETDDTTTTTSILADGQGWICQAYFAAFIDGGTINVTNCYSTGDIYTYNFAQAGGIFGLWAGTSISGTAAINATNCYSTGEIRGLDSGGIFGGAAGYNMKSGTTITATNCHNTGSISSQGAGGIFGAYTGNSAASGSTITATDCYSTGPISGPLAGGIFGVYAGWDATGGTIYAVNCHSEGEISGTYAGGIFGEGAGYRDQDGTFCRIDASGCYSEGIISGAEAGGIFGANAGQRAISSTIISATNCHSIGPMSASDTGGIFGCAAGANGFGVTIYAYQCYSTGAIGPASGGIFGSYVGDASNLNTYLYETQIYADTCYSTGAISTYGGGIFGANTGIYSVFIAIFANFCYSTGAIGENGGGIFGSSTAYDCVYCDIHAYQCYSTGAIGGSSGGDDGGGGGGIFGYATGMADTPGQTSYCTIYANGCYSTGVIGQNSGGIFGSRAGYQVFDTYIYAIYCYSTGDISTYGGGIFGYATGNNATANGNTTYPACFAAYYCYSLGTIGYGGGGIFGSFQQGVYSGPSVTFYVTNCYTTGYINSTAGGIYGSYVGLISAAYYYVEYCYTLGAVADQYSGCFFSNYGIDVNKLVSNGSICAGGGSWSDTDARATINNSTNGYISNVWVFYAQCNNSALGYPWLLEGSPTHNIYLQQTETGTIQLSSDNVHWTNIISWPLAICNMDPWYGTSIPTYSNTLTLQLTTNITFNSDMEYIGIASDNITIDGSYLGVNKIVYIDGLTTGYPGLVQNGAFDGTTGVPAYKNTTIQNIGVVALNGSILNPNQGWVCQVEFGFSLSSGFIDISNCYSTGVIGSSSGLYEGGIFGNGAGSFINGGTITATNCYSTGDITGNYTGGIYGNAVGYGGYGGIISAINCYSTGIISGTNSGGIFGTGAGEEALQSPEIYATNCYSTGLISGFNSGGIFGGNAGIRAYAFTPPCVISATNCYSTGDISGNDSGGIFGPCAGTYARSGIISATNCFSTGKISINQLGGGGIFGGYTGAYAYGGSVAITISATNCYSVGEIGLCAGGIFGANTATDASGNLTISATNCYSTGTINGSSTGGAGGIYGYSAGYLVDGPSPVSIVANYCYSTGTIGQNAGGIYGNAIGLAASSNFLSIRTLDCYVIGTYTTSNSNGIYGLINSNGLTYSNNGSLTPNTGTWSDSSATSTIGNASNPSSNTWFDDSTANNVPWLLAPFDADIYNPNSLDVSANIQINSGSGLFQSNSSPPYVYSIYDDGSITGTTTIDSSGNIQNTGITYVGDYPIDVFVKKTNSNSQIYAYNKNAFTFSVVDATVPSAPTNATVVVTGSESVAITFTKSVSEGGSPITNYYAYVSIFPQSVGSCTGTQTTINVTGLTEGTSYTFSVVAVNEIGSSIASNAVTVTTGTKISGTNVYLQQTSTSSQVQWSSTGSSNWVNITAWPLLITVSNLYLTTNITFSTSVGSKVGYIIIGSDNTIIDGSNNLVTINGISDYPGLVQNGTSTSTGFKNITIQNIGVSTSSSSTLAEYQGWVCQQNFGSYISSGSINVSNCYSTGTLSNSYSGGIFGAYAGNHASATAIISASNCHSTESMSGQEAGGIFGAYAGYYASGTAIISATNCYSSGTIGSSSSTKHQGGIFGGFAGQYLSGSANIYATNCYSTGPISETDCGGIFGNDAGNLASGGTIYATNCYSIGSISGANAGGIFGGYVGNSATGGQMYATTCYSTGTISGNDAGGIFGGYTGTSVGTSVTSGTVNISANYCYSNGTVSNASAGGIFGGYAGNGANSSRLVINASRCYTVGTFTNNNGVYGTNKTIGNTDNCAIPNSGTWSDTTANSSIYYASANTWLDYSSATNVPWLLTSFDAAIYNPNAIGVSASTSVVTSGAGLFQSGSSPYYTYLIYSYGTLPASPVTNIDASGAITTTLQVNGTYKASVLVGKTSSSVYYAYNSNSFTFTAGASVPGPPTNVTATAISATSVTISFGAPTFNGGSPIKSYTATSNPGGITKTVTQEGGGTINMTGLTSNTSYTFSIYDTNSANLNSTSVSVNATTRTNSITQSGGIVYLKQDQNSQVEWSSDNSNWKILDWPLTIINNNASSALTVKFTENIIFSASVGSTNGYIIIGSTNIIIDGSNNLVTINGISDYLGLVRNGTSSNTPPGFTNITIQNIGIDVSGNSTIGEKWGWICQAYFGAYISSGTIAVSNCYSTGTISNSYSGGIYGYRAGYYASGTAIISATNCYSSGTISGQYAGGIFGGDTGQAVSDSAEISATNCYSSGTISGSQAGGIFAAYAGNVATGGKIYATNCYSTGNITTSTNQGGIFGSYAGNQAVSPAKIYAESCYTTGTIGTSGAGGIFGNGAGPNITSSNGGVEIYAINCYSMGDISGSAAGGIFGTQAAYNSTSIPQIYATTCYSMGLIIGPGAGGIFGNDAGYNASGSGARISANYCYSTGDVSNNDAGGIFGSYAGNGGGGSPAVIDASGCYTVGKLNNTSHGVYGSNKTSGYTYNCAFPNTGVWSDSSANVSINYAPTNTWLDPSANGSSVPWLLTAFDAVIYNPNALNSIVASPTPKTSGAGLFTSGYNYLIYGYANLPQSTTSIVSTTGVITATLQYGGSYPIDVLVGEAKTSGIYNTYIGYNSNTFTFGVTATAPSLPVIVSVTTTDVAATITFTASTYSGNTTNTINYVAKATLGSVSISSPSTTSTTPFVLTGLTPGTQYSFTVVATNTGSQSTSSASVTASTTSIIYASTTVLITQSSSTSAIQYSVDQDTTLYTMTRWPYTIIKNSQSTSPTLTVYLTKNIVFSASVGSTNGYFIIGSDNITFDGSHLGVNYTVTINASITYPGLLKNGTITTPGFKNITIQNIGVVPGTTTPTLAGNQGWVCQQYFGSYVTSGFIDVSNCYSTGAIVNNNSGGIFGAYAGYDASGSAIISASNCYSSGTMGSTSTSNTSNINQGGIFGAYAGYDAAGAAIISASNCHSTGPMDGFEVGGIFGAYAGYAASGSANVYATNCYSSGIIGNANKHQGGIFGSFAGYALSGTANVYATNCYSTGRIYATDCGGIFGNDAGNLASGGTIYAINCYSMGLISGGNAGGIFGAYVGNGATGGQMYAKNCYSMGTIGGTNAGGIFGTYTGPDITSGAVKIYANYCYSTGALTNSAAGGIFGNSTGKDSNGNISTKVTIDASGCYAAGTTSSTSSRGIYGTNTASFCTQSNSIASSTSTGGWLDSSANVSINYAPANTWLDPSANGSSDPWLLTSFDSPIYNPDSSGNITANTTVKSGNGLFTTGYSYLIYGYANLPESTTMIDASGAITATLQYGGDYPIDVLVGKPVVTTDSSYNTYIGYNSDTFTFGVNATAPSPFTNVTATATSATSAIVTFTAPTFSGDTGGMTYVATATPTSGTGAVSSPSTSATSITLIGLTQQTEYNFKVVATNTDNKTTAGNATNPATTWTNSITQAGGIVYLKQDQNSQVEWSSDNTNWKTLDWPLTIKNTASTALTVQLTDNITFNTSVGKANGYIILNSDNIAIDGSNNLVTIDGITNYLGLLKNGTSESPSFKNITIKNIGVDTSNNSTLAASEGWVCQQYFGSYISSGFIDVSNCYSTGAISNDNGGGIFGSYTGYDTAGAAIISVTNCYSIGVIGGSNTGGIFGYQAGSGASGGTISASNCYSTGDISGNYTGGIFGGYPGQSISGGQIYATTCYSTGAISGTYAGGIFGVDAGQSSSGGTISATNCYSTGNITGPDAGGIFGKYAGNSAAGPLQIYATSCYAMGTISGTQTGGIFGSNAGNAVKTGSSSKTTISANFCYSVGNITDTTAGGIFGSYAGANGALSSYLKIDASGCYASGTQSNTSNGIYGSNKNTSSNLCNQSNSYGAGTGTGGWLDSSANISINYAPTNTWIDYSTYDYVPWLLSAFNATIYDPSQNTYTASSTIPAKSGAGLFQSVSSPYYDYLIYDDEELSGASIVETTGVLTATLQYGGSYPVDVLVGKGLTTASGYPTYTAYNGNTFTFNVNSTVPSPPTNLKSISTGTTTVTLGFTPPTYDGGKPITGYTAYLNGTTTQVGSADGGSTVININNLTPGATYQFVLVAKNLMGSSSPSAPTDEIVVGATVPDPPIIGTAYLDASNNPVVAFTAPSFNGGNAITSYTATSTPGGINVSISTGLPSPDGGGTITMTGLDANTRYTFKVFATNGNGDSVDSAASNPITTSATVPGPPTDVTATASGATSATVNFTAPNSNGGAIISKYTATSNNIEYGDIETGLPLPGRVGTINVTDLSANSIYTFKVFATNSNGNGANSVASKQITTGTTVPNAPIIGTAYLDLSNNPVVAFTAPISDGGNTITSYTATSTPDNIIISISTNLPLPGQGGTITMTGLDPGTPYTFKVFATNDNGKSADSAASNQITPAATVPDAPTIGSVNLDASNNVVVAFTAPISDGGNTITSYTATSTPDNIIISISTNLPLPGQGGTITMTGLDPGTQYTFKVFATNDIGKSADSDASDTITTDTTVPDAPIIGTAYLDLSNNVVVAFTAPISDGGNTITSYTATSTPDNIIISISTNLPSPGDDGTITMTGLDPGTTYTFKVFATNDNGNSTNSAASNQITPDSTVPGVPTNIRAAARGTLSAIIFFTAPISDGGSEIESYTATSTSGGKTGSKLTNLPLPGGIGTINVTDLSGNSSYRFKVFATNANGNSVDSVASNQITTGASVPDPPTIGNAVVDASNNAAVSFIAPIYTGGSSINSYTATSFPGGITGILYQASSGTIKVYDLDPGTKYTFTVVATNDSGNSDPSNPSNEVTTNATVPDAPTIGAATETGPTSATVAFVAPNFNGGDVINSYTATSNPDGITGILYQAGSGTIPVSGLTTGTSYTFTVFATNDKGKSVDSAASNQITTGASVPDPPTIGNATVNASNNALVVFTAPIYTGGSAIQSYTATSTTGGKTGTLDQAGSGTITVYDLDPGAAYRFKVVATNAVGNSDPSNPSNEVTANATVPDPPTIGQATETGTNSANVTFFAPSFNGGDVIYSYTATSNPDGKTGIIETGLPLPGQVGTIPVSELTAGTSYTFTVFATNDKGDSVDSAASNSITPAATVPDRPTIGKVIIDASNNVDVNFVAPAFDGGSPITGYEAYIFGDQTTSVGTAGADSGFVEVSSDVLTPNTIYRFTVVALNNEGSSRHSNPSKPITTNASVPDPPIIGSVTGVTATSATVNFTPPSYDGGYPITGYIAYVGQTSEEVGRSLAGSTSINVSGLTPDTVYTFTVVATNINGSGDPSNQSDPITTDATVPGTPTNVKAFAKGSTSATVTFVEPDDGGSDITGYTAYFFGTTTVAGSVNTNTTLITVNNLTSGTSYTFTVYAQNANGPSATGGVSNEMTAGTTVPSTPTNVTATASGTTSATVTFVEPADGGSVITGYTAYFGNTTIVAGLVNTNTTLINISGLSPGTSYTFTVYAENANGPSATGGASNQITTLTTVPGAPTDVKAFAKGTTLATITFVEPANGGSPITGYIAYFGDSFDVAGSVNSNTTLINISGLDAGASYIFTVYAQNANGLSATGGVSNGIVAGTTVPDPPTIGPVTGVTTSSAIVNYTPPAFDGGSPITGYIAYFGQTIVEAGRSGEGSTSINVSGLDPGTEYTFTVVATNINGSSDPSGLSTKIKTLSTVPGAPTNVNALVDGTNEATVFFTAPNSNGGAIISSYTATPSAYGEPITIYTNLPLPGRTGSIDMVGLAAGTPYTFTVVATNINGNSANGGPSTSVTTVPSVPDPPTDVSATASGFTTAIVTFTAPELNGGKTILSYKAVSSPDGITGVIVRDLPPANTVGTITVRGLTNGAEYTFTVVAINVLGSSEPSEPSRSITIEMPTIIVFQDPVDPTIQTTIYAPERIIYGDVIASVNNKNIYDILTVSVGPNVIAIGGFSNADDPNPDNSSKLNTLEFTEAIRLKTIGAYAFQSCTNLLSITIPASVTTIDTYAFEGCTGLINIAWLDPADFTTLGDYAFDTHITDASGSSAADRQPTLPGTVTYNKTRSALNLPDVLNPIDGPASIYFYLYDIVFIADPICFNKGTEILCFNEETDKEEYVLVENLKKGDLVKSYKHGYRKIDAIVSNNMTNDPGKWSTCMYKMKKTDTNGLTKDLIVTGGHSILVDNLSKGKLKKLNDSRLRSKSLKIDGKYLLLSSVSEDFAKLENTDVYRWYHFTLENDGDNDRRFGVWANGILSETPSKNLLIKYSRPPRNPDDNNDHIILMNDYNTRTNRIHHNKHIIIINDAVPTIQNNNILVNLTPIQESSGDQFTLQYKDRVNAQVLMKPSKQSRM